MEHTFYSGSAKVSPTALLFIPVTLAVSMLLGLIYAVIIFYNPLIYLSAILFGGFCVVLGIVANYTIDKAKCRNKWIALTLGLILGLGAVYISHVFLISNVSQFSIMQLFFAPMELWYMVQILAEQGYYSFKDSTVSGGFLWTIWGIEALGLIMVPVFLSWSETSSRVFCEKCNSWADEDKNVAQFAFEDEELLKRKFLAKDLSFLDQTIPIDQNTNQYYSIDEELCKKCDDIYTMSLRKNTITVSDGKVNTNTKTLFEDLIVDKSTHEALAAINERKNQESIDEFNTILKSTMALMVIADGKIEDEEIDSMTQIYSNFTESEPTTTEMKTLAEEMQSKDVSITDYLTEHTDKLNFDGKAILIKAALMIASADGEMSEEEKEGIYAMAGALKLSDDDFNEIVNDSYSKEQG